MADGGGEALTADAYHEILVRSQAADCLRWRLVSKQWDEMVTSRFFLLEQRRRHPTRPLPLIFFRYDISDEGLLPAGVHDSKARDDTVADEDDPLRDAEGLDALVPAVHADRALLLLESLPKPDARGEGVDARALLLLWALSSPGARADRGRGSVDARARCGVPLLPFHYGDTLRLLLAADDSPPIPTPLAPALYGGGSAFDALLASLSDASGRLVELRVDAVDVHARVSTPLIWFRGDDRAFDFHGCKDGMLLVSYGTGLFAYHYRATTETIYYEELPPIHQHAKIIGIYSEERERGAPIAHQEYRVLYFSKEKPFRYGYFCSASHEHVSIEHPTTSEHVAIVLDNGMKGYQLVPAFVNGALHWVRPGVRYPILVFEAVTSQFRFLMPPDTDESIYELVGHGGFVMVTEVDGDDPIITMWRLNDYTLEGWDVVHEKDLPLDAILPFIDDFEHFGEPVLHLISEEGDVLVECPDDLLHFDSDGVLVARYHHGRLTFHMARSGLFPNV